MISCVAIDTGGGKVCHAHAAGSSGDRVCPVFRFVDRQIWWDKKIVLLCKGPGVQLPLSPKFAHREPVC